LEPLKLVVVLAVVAVLALAFGLGCGALIAWTIVRWDALRRRGAVQALLPTAAPVVGLVPGYTPPHPPREFVRLSLISLVAGPFLLFVLPWLFRRGRAGRLVAFTEGGDTWLLSTKKIGSTVPAALVGQQPTTDWRPRQTFRAVYVTVAGERLCLGRLGFTDQLPRRQLPSRT
jgi:hypothetical protein